MRFGKGISILAFFFVSISLIWCNIPDITNDIEVANLTAEEGNNQIKLSWIEPDNTTIDHIQIEYEYGIKEVDVRLQEIVIKNLHNQVKYGFIVKTVDKEGNKSNGISITATPIGVDPTHFEICDYLALNWGGVTIRYNSVDDFISECHMIDFYYDKVEMLQYIRPLIQDGHFYIGLNDNHPENDFDNAKVIPIVTTYDNSDNVVIAKSTPDLRNLGLKEGNIIKSINGINTEYYINRIIELLPQSSIYESKEKAYRLLFSYILSPNQNQYLEIPLFINQNWLLISFQDMVTGKFENVVVNFEYLSEYIPDDIFDMTMNNYWSIQREYDVQSTDICISDNEFATLKEVNGEKWLIYHPLSFIFDTDLYITQEFTCYLQYQSQADYFVMDLRDSVGGGWHQTNIMLGLVDSSGSFILPRKYWNNGSWMEYSTFRLEAVKDPQLPSIGESVPVYIWPNAICGSACDMFLYNIKNSVNNHIKIIGKPSAGRFIAVYTEGYMDYTISIPVLSIMDENQNHLEGTSIQPDYYFDVDPIYYQTADDIFLEYVNFIKSNGL